MEFSRRGPAADGNRFHDPPPHGGLMLRLRDTLLSQLQSDRLRQEIIVAELAKIERAMALRDAFSHQATPMSRQGIADAGAGRWPFSIEQSILGWEHCAGVGKLPDKDGCQRVAAESKSRMPVVEDCAGECLKPCEVKAGQRTAGFDEQKLSEFSETIPPSKTPPAAKWELIGITIPVKKPKPPMKWNCAVCQVKATSEQDLQRHCAGQKHQSNVATLDPGTKASGQKAKIAPEPSSHGSELKRTSSIKWSCSTCQASGMCESHLKSTRHQQNVAGPCKEGDGNDIDTPKNDVPHEAKLADINVPKHSQKPPSVWSCSICQVTCTCESNLKSHLKGRRHVAEVQAQKPPSVRSCSICQVTCTCESNLMSHLKGRRHLAEVQALLVIKNMTSSTSKNARSEKVEKQQPLYFCEVCNVYCNSGQMLAHHLTGKKHQAKLNAKN